jgi:hypothetical protein
VNRLVTSARRRQQQEDQLALDQFRRISGLLPGIYSRGADPPDFVIANGIHLTSVEMTAFHSGSHEKGGSKAAADEGNAQRLIERAQAILARDHPDPHVEVRPYLITDRLARRGLDRLADLLAQAIARRAPAVPEVGEPPARVEVTWTEDLPEELASVLAHASVARWRPERWKPEQNNVWLLGSVGYAAIDAGEVLAIIRRKEVDPPRYQAGFDARWLLIYGLWQASSFFDFDYLKPKMFTSKFDGVAFVDAGTARNVQIA